MALRPFTTPGRRKFDHEIAFGLFLLGMTQNELAARFNVSQQSLSLIAIRQDWNSKRDAIALERVAQAGPELRKEQMTLRGEEIRMAKELIVGATRALKRLNWEKCSTGDVLKALELASKLGRLGTGLPLQPMELNVQVDLSGEMKDAIERVYGAKQPQLAESTTQPAAEAQVIDVEAVKDDKDIGNGI